MTASPKAPRNRVALETTAISHGLPYPENLSLVSRLDQAVTQGGGVPVFIGVVEGAARIGLSRAELEKFAQAEHIMKASTRDLPILAAQKRWGATTVASTIYLARRAGIEVMATGGLGGVHRETTWDVSADLPQLARTKIIVVCSGAKAILDLPRTREWLETAGIPVLGYETEEFPSFYSRKSGLSVDLAVRSPGEVAAIWQKMETESALLVAVPVPAEAEFDAEPYIEQAMHRLHSEGVRGKDVTPFLLREVARLSGGRSLQANLALLEHNAFVAGEIAAALEMSGTAP